jgi:hypothetical protein
MDNTLKKYEFQSEIHPFIPMKQHYRGADGVDAFVWLQPHDKRTM